MALKDSLISYWRLDETSGDRNDAYGTNHLTQRGTVGSVAGVISNAADFDTTNLLYRASNASLQTGDISFTVCCWAVLDNKTPADGFYGLVTKVASSGSQVNGDYWLDYSQSQDKFEFNVLSSGGISSPVRSTVPTAGTRYFIVAWVDKDANTVNIQVNNGTVVSDTKAVTVAVSNNEFSIGSFDFNNSPLGDGQLDGNVDEVGFWKRVLTANERTRLYNNGNGLAFSNWEFHGGMI